MNFYWNPPPTGIEEAPVDRDRRLDQNLGSFSFALTQTIDSFTGALNNIVAAIHESTEQQRELVQLFKGNASARTTSLEEAYTLAVIQERKQIRENLEELMLGLGTIGEVVEFLAQRPELKEFYDKVCAGGDIRAKLRDDVG